MIRPFLMVIALLLGLLAVAGSAQPVSEIWRDLAASQPPWQPLGASSLAVDPVGMPLLAWLQWNSLSNQGNVYVRRWNGTSWVENGVGSASLAGISDVGGTEDYPSMVTDWKGDPVVVWQSKVGGQWEIYGRRWTGVCWEEIGPSSAHAGGISDDAQDSMIPALAVDARGNVTVAWICRFSPSERALHLRRWDQSLGRWEELGGSASGFGISGTGGAVPSKPGLVVDSAGNPIVAWSEKTPPTEGSHVQVYVRRWTGSQWAEMGPGSASGGGVSDTPSDSLTPVLAIGDDDRPAVAWRESISAGRAEIYLRRWSGSVWESLSGSASGGGVSLSGGFSRNPAVCVGPEGDPAVAWCQQSTEDTWVYVRHWDGASWAEVGSGSAQGEGLGAVRFPIEGLEIAADPGGRLTAAWLDESKCRVRTTRPVSAVSLNPPLVDFGPPSADRPIHRPVVVRSTGVQPVHVASVEIAGSAFALTPDSPQSFSLASGESALLDVICQPGVPQPSSASLTLALEDGGFAPRAFLFAADGSRPSAPPEWRGIGGSAMRDGLSDATGESIWGPAMALDPNGFPVVVWSENRAAGGSDVLLRRWNGRVWAEWPPGSGSARGISDTPTDSWSPTVAIDHSGHAAVAWAEAPIGSAGWHVFVRQWDGHAWAEMSGSASGGGISGRPAYWHHVALALDSLGRPFAAWADRDTDVVWLREWDGTAWLSSEEVCASGEVAFHERFPALALDRDDNPLVVSLQGGKTLRVRRRIDGVWENVGPPVWTPIDPGDGGVGLPVLVIDGSGAPVILWSMTLQVNANISQIYAALERGRVGGDGRRVDVRRRHLGHSLALRDCGSRRGARRLPGGGVDRAPRPLHGSHDPPGAFSDLRPAVGWRRLGGGESGLCHG